VGAPGKKRNRRAAPTVCARLAGHVTLAARADGLIDACFDGVSIGLGTFGAAVAERALALRVGLPLDSLAAGRRAVDKDIHRLVRRLAAHGFLEYGVGSPGAEDQAVIEPQVADYWPRMPKLGDADILLLSRFAYMRRRGDDLVLESPRAEALFSIRDPEIAAMLAMLSTPQPVKRLRRQNGFPGLALLGLLVDCKILLKIKAGGRARPSGLRAAEGDQSLVLWDFHDLLFHARSTEGRHANPMGGLYSYADLMPPLPATRPRWPGKTIDLGQPAPAEALSPFAKLLRDRHSVRDFDDRRPIALAELACFLDGAARVLSTWSLKAEFGDDAPMVAHTARPYPSAGASYGLELYVAADKCEGLARGFYHYDAGAHALVAIDARASELDALLAGAAYAMGADAAPQVLLTIAARFGRVSWKYSAIAYALILKDTGVLMQTLYLMATHMGLGGCAIGSHNIKLFAEMTGIEFHVESPVGQFALGRPKAGNSD
jgi:SagB-type dehydrogenase family enzyme